MPGQLLSKLSAICLLFLFASAAIAAPQGEQEVGNYKVLYSLFNSTFLSPEIAQSYQIKRSAKEVVLNVSVMDKTTGKALNSTITGVAKNLIQQEKPLSFRQISEQGAIYSIAVLRTTEREVFHFLLRVKPVDGEAFDVKFTQELFVNP